MRRETNRGTSDSSQSSDALADIALNSLGLILIVMLVYILLFQDTTRKVVNAAEVQAKELRELRGVASENEQLRAEVASMDPEIFRSMETENKLLKAKAAQADDTIAKQKRELSTVSTRLRAASAIQDELKQKLEGADAKIAELSSTLRSAERQLASAKRTEERSDSVINSLKEDIARRATENQWSGLWRFRNSVEELVDHNDNSEEVDWTIDYFLYMNVVDGKVTGALFGAHEIDTDNENTTSQSYATIEGTLTTGGQLDVELSFSRGSSDTGSEHLRCKLRGDAFDGRLESGKHRYGYRNYVGKTRGTKLNESVFK